MMKLAINNCLAIRILALLILTASTAGISPVAAHGTDVYRSRSGELFLTLFGNSGAESFSSVIENAAGDFLVTGYTNSSGAGGMDCIITSHDSDGTISASYSHGTLYYDYWYDITQVTDGGYVTVGVSDYSGSGNEDILMVKHLAPGARVWTSLIGGTYNDYAVTVNSTSDGGVILCGYTVSYGAGSSDGLIIKCDSSGNPVWNRVIGGTVSERFFDVMQTTDGGYIATGLTASFGPVFGQQAAMVVKLNSSGTISWLRTLGGQISGDNGIRVLVSYDGGFVVLGQTGSYGAGSSDLIAFKLNSSGSLLWTTTAGGSGSETAAAAIEMSDNGIVIAGITGSYGAGNEDIFLVKLTSGGTYSWSKTIGGTGNDSVQRARKTSDGGILISGYTTSFGAAGYDAILIRTDEDGDIPGCTQIAACSPSISYPVPAFSSPGFTSSSPVIPVNGLAHILDALSFTESEICSYEDTPTPTETPTQTPTQSPTNTPTQTPTNTPTQTPTNTPTQTPTPTSTPTDTPTSTPSETPTLTPTSTSTNTATETPTLTPADTPTTGPTQTPMPIPASGATGLGILMMILTGLLVFAVKR